MSHQNELASIRDNLKKLGQNIKFPDYTDLNTNLKSDILKTRDDVSLGYSPEKELNPKRKDKSRVFQKPNQHVIVVSSEDSAKKSNENTDFSNRGNDDELEKALNQERKGYFYLQDVLKAQKNSLAEK
ncbi:hypothetical protein RF11_10845 [Thelohanellus kitauei]|uniref:Uncharacterized protein n=1 Tax=Thelohanellus kitauei TaxID=669202 RepID=A0A0C2IUL4_THEKT|nr:hypothetical protein RF11_05606 [Thelohanellus kitauei]KII65479.1 hypothetical protein RF11_10845 [Thelohanellus kitauei]